LNIYNRELEKYEYSYIYNKLNLKKDARLRKFLLRLFINNSAKMSEFKKLGFNYFECIKEKLSLKSERYLSRLRLFRRL